MTFQSVRNSTIYVDHPGFISPSAITEDILRPDLLLVLPNKCLYFLDLTVGFESNIRTKLSPETYKVPQLSKATGQSLRASKVYQLVNQHSWGT